MSESKLPYVTGQGVSVMRRRWLMGVVAGVAALGGTGLALKANPSKESGASSAESAFWKLEFAAPDGTVLRMASLQGKPLLLNFWATWCPPCVAELPSLSRFYQSNSIKGWQVLGVAVDQLAAVQRFLAKSPVAFPVVLAGMEGVEISRTLGNLSGGLPFSVVLGSDGVVAHRKMGQVSPDDLRAWMALK